MRRMEHISRKIWKVMTITVVAFILVIFILNGTLINGVKNNIVYDELESRIFQVFDDIEMEDEGPDFKKHMDIEARREGFRILYFRVDLGIEADKILLDPVTQRIVEDNFDEDIIDKIYRRAIKRNDVREKGVVKTLDANYYFITSELQGGNSVDVYFTHIGNTRKDLLIYFGVLCALIILSYFPARIVAKEISKPILELEDYAEEISNRNWSAKHPETDIIEVDQLCASLDLMKHSLRVAEERDRQFLQKTSHDLKTPVMIIKGYAQAMIDGVVVENEETPAEVIINESNRLERKIQQLLQLNTIGHTIDQANDFEVVRMDRLLNSLITRFQVVKPDLEWQKALTYFEMDGNPEALLVSFENIFENQVRFAKNQVVTHMREDSGYMVLSIENDGEAFSVEDPMILFDPYKKDMEGNFGLGLAIVKRVIHGHGGDIIAKNKEKGVVFEIKFKIKGTE